MSYKLEQLYLKLEKLLGFRNMQEKLEKERNERRIDKEHLILWDRRDLNRCTDKGAFARITGSTSLKSSPFLSTDFEDTFLVLYILSM